MMVEFDLLNPYPVNENVDVTFLADNLLAFDVSLHLHRFLNHKLAL